MPMRGADITERHHSYLLKLHEQEQEELDELAAALREEEYAELIYEYIARLDREEAEIAMRLEENDEPQ